MVKRNWFTLLFKEGREVLIFRIAKPFLMLLLCLLSCTNQSNDTLTICFTGDLLLDRGVRMQIEQHRADTLFSNVSALFHQTDAVVANLECPVTKRKEPVYKRFMFRAEPEWLPALKKAGITHLAMANNHSYDQGRDGMEDTYQALIANGLVPVGYGKNHQLACEPVIVKKGNVQVAIFNSVEMLLENFPFLPDKPCMCQSNAEALASAISEFKRKHSGTFVVVVLHWGAEYQPTPMSSQISDAMIMIHSGADAIIGHHPHVIQTISHIEGKPVFYSLGNFVFDPKKPKACEGLIVQFSFNRTKTKVIKHEFSIINCRPVITGSEELEPQRREDAKK
jgi:poly-gamma-glutamate capsule biosynthesis protein CapA/YwtB (metallophosphatase superfamily)